MIFIISEKEDHSTSEVIQWLNYYKSKFVRVNEGDQLCLRTIKISNKKECQLILNSKERGDINLSEISAVWYRRGGLKFKTPNVDFIQNLELKQQVIRHLIRENNILEDYLQYLLYAIPHIGTFSTRGVNKLVLLDLARQLNIEIPDTFIVSDHKPLDYSQRFITKSISEVFTPKIQGKDFITYTEAINHLPRTSTFFPSLFQTQIDKEADIRVFILRDKVYSMAIMSQGNKQTMIDFRKYLSVNPNRHFQFKLPSEIERKLIELLKRAKLETASVDMILTRDGRFVFLEANPISQFSMTSKPCNTFLEREFALTLIELSKQNSNEKR